MQEFQFSLKEKIKKGRYVP